MSTTVEGWWERILLRGKEDKEKGNQHFVNLEHAVWVRWWLQQAAVARRQHYKNTASPRRPIERG